MVYLLPKGPFGSGGTPPSPTDSESSDSTVPKGGEGKIRARR